MFLSLQNAVRSLTDDSLGNALFVIGVNEFTNVLREIGQVQKVLRNLHGEMTIRESFMT